MKKKHLNIVHLNITTQDINRGSIFLHIDKNSNTVKLSTEDERHLRPRKIINYPIKNWFVILGE